MSFNGRIYSSILRIAQPRYSLFGPFCKCFVFSLFLLTYPLDITYTQNSAVILPTTPSSFLSKITFVFISEAFMDSEQPTSEPQPLPTQETQGVETQSNEDSVSILYEMVVNLLI